MTGGAWEQGANKGGGTLKPGSDHGYIIGPVSWNILKRRHGGRMWAVTARPERALGVLPRGRAAAGSGGLIVAARIQVGVFQPWNPNVQGIPQPD